VGPDLRPSRRDESRPRMIGHTGGSRIQRLSTVPDPGFRRVTGEGLKIKLPDMRRNNKRTPARRRRWTRRHSELRARLDGGRADPRRPIRSGQVDAVVVSGPQGEQVFFPPPDRGCRARLPRHHRGDERGSPDHGPGGVHPLLQPAFLRDGKDADGGDRRKTFYELRRPAQQPAIRALVADAQAGPVRRRLVLQAGGRSPLSVQLSANLLVAADPPCICMVIST